VIAQEKPDGAAEVMIQQLCTLKGVGAQSATVLVREGFVREFRNGRALGSYAGLVGALPCSDTDAEVKKIQIRRGFSTFAVFRRLL